MNLVRPALLLFAFPFFSFGQDTLFHYRVSQTDAALVASGAVPNVAGADGIAQGGLTLSADIPTVGVPPGAGDRSLDNGGDGGVTAPGSQQLSNGAITAAGGFTYETWLKWSGGGNVNAVIDYAGTEKLRIPSGGGALDMNFDRGTGAQVLANVTEQEWHYIAAVFTHNGQPESGGQIDGTLTWYFDGKTPAGNASATKDDFGDGLNRTIGVATHPNGFVSDYFDGLVYEPRVTLGALTPAQLLFSAGPRIEDFSSDVDSIAQGQNATLSWEVSNADSVHLAPAPGPVANPAGSTTVSPETTTTYTLTATNAEGSSAAQLTVFVDEPPAEPLLNEFLADNNRGIEDEDGESSDWIEIRNPNAFAIPLDGWSLTDDPLHASVWTFPLGASIPGDGFLVVFASDKDRRDPAAELHTDFRLDDAGEYLALLRPDGTIAQEFAPTFPRQFEDRSYGWNDDGTALNYFDLPTPGAANGAGVLGFVEDTKFEPNRGFFDQPFDVTVTSATPGATIVYTTDASTPTLTNGTAVTAPDPATPPTATVAIAQTTTLRAAAFLNDFQPTNTDTHTYLFLDDVIVQSPNGEAPPGWPSGPVNGQVFDYGMDPNIVNNPTWGAQLMGGLQQIPSISLVTDQHHLTSASTGIYTHAGSDGDTWERPGSIELLNPDNTPGFQANGGVRIRGGFSRGGFNPKHSFRLFFRGIYGPRNLEYPLFDDEGADEFDKVDLRTAQNYAWSNDTFNNELHNTFLRDVFHRDTQRDMGQPYTRSRYYHLYLNGQYWGLYQTQERSESAFANTYFGGNRENWDVIKPGGGAVRASDGNLTAYYRLHSLATAGFASDSAYYRVQGKNPDGSDNPQLERHVDIDNLIDYMLVNIFCGNQDGPLSLGGGGPNNFYALRNRERAARDAWKFFCHDSEHSMAAADHNVNTNVTGNTNTGSNRTAFNPRWLSQQLAQHPDYRRRFGDRVQKHFFNGGALTTDNALARWTARADQIDHAIVAESARWGDQHNEPPLDKRTWQTELGWMHRTFLPNRGDIVLDQLRSVGLFPDVAAPAFSQHGGTVPGGTAITITAPDGAIHYTTDGADPRSAGTLYTGPVVLEQFTELRAAVLVGNEWSALVEAIFLVDTIPAATANLVISEFSYRPAAATALEDPAEVFDRGDFEFVELLNIGGATIDLSGVRFDDGIEFAFPDSAVLAPEARLLLVKNAAAFEARYGSGLPIAGEFGGNLSNDGERIIILDAAEQIIHRFTYNDQPPWPASADGDGYSLILLCPELAPDHSLPSNWRSSVALHGSPGTIDTVTLESWMAAEGIVDSNSDLDFDGLNALAEFATGSDPWTFTPPGEAIAIETVPAGDPPAAYLVLSVRRDRSAGGVALVPERSLDLIDWWDSPLGFLYLGETDQGDGTSIVRWRSLVPLDIDPRAFLRLRIDAKE